MTLSFAVHIHYQLTESRTHSAQKVPFQSARVDYEGMWRLRDLPLSLIYLHSRREEM